MVISNSRTRPENKKNEKKAFYWYNCLYSLSQEDTIFLKDNFLKLDETDDYILQNTMTEYPILFYFSFQVMPENPYTDKFPPICTIPIKILCSTFS